VEEGVQVLEDEGVTTALLAGRKGAVTRTKCCGCGGTGHKRSECPNSGERTQGDFKYECWNCGEKGHKRSDCPGARKPAPKPNQMTTVVAVQKQQKKSRSKFDSCGVRASGDVLNQERERSRRVHLECGVYLGSCCWKRLENEKT
jgi:hypothetical protein